VARPLTLLYVATFLFTLMQGAGLPLIPQHLKLTFGAGLFLVGLVSGVFGAMQIFLRLPLGDVTDRRGRRFGLFAAFGTAAVSGAFYVLAASPAWLAAAQALFGFASGIFWVSANAYLFDHAAPGEIHAATSNYAMALGLAFLVGPPLGGAVADTYGFAVALLVFPVAGLLGLGLVALMPEAARLEGPRPEGSVGVRARRLLRHPDLMMSVVGTLAFSTLFSTLSAFFPVYLVALGFGAFLVGVLTAVRQVASTATRSVMPRLLARFGARNVIVAGVAVSAAFVALTPFLTDPWALAALSAATGLGMGVMVPANLTLIAGAAPAAERGLANGLYGTALGVGSSVAPLAFGYAGATFGAAAPFWLAALTAPLVIALGWNRAKAAGPAAPAPG